MKLFISSGLWKYRGYQMELAKLDNTRTKLIFYNLQNVADVEKNRVEAEYEKIEFIIPANITDLQTRYRDYETFSSKLRKKANGYTFESAVSEENSKVVYALLHYEQVVPSDIYIHASMKKYVEVLEKIQFYDVEPDYGEYLVKIYFVKITIPQGETIPFYLSWKNKLKYLENQLIFIKDKYCGIDVKKGKTYIRLDSLKRKEYISLSEL